MIDDNRVDDVLHKSWTNSSFNQKLESVVDKCLQEASRRQFSSMAIPALGTGVLGFPRDVAANTIISTVNRFQQTSPKTSLKEVKVVVFNDPATILVNNLVYFCTQNRFWLHTFHWCFKNIPKYFKEMICSHLPSPISHLIIRIIAKIMQHT